MSDVWRCVGCPEGPDWRVDMDALVASCPWLEPLGECPQDPIFHAEGDVLTHLGMVLRELAALPTANAHSWGSCVDLRVRACRPTPWAAVLTPFPSVARVVMGPTDAR